MKHENGYNNHYEKYYWNESPSSCEYSEKAKVIKPIPGWWEVVLEHYLDIKNDFLRKNDYNNHSFICYIQAGNDVYNQMRQKTKIIENRLLTKHQKM